MPYQKKMSKKPNISARKYFEEDYKKFPDLYREFTTDGDFEKLAKIPGFVLLVKERYNNSKVSVPKDKEEAVPIQNIITTVKMTHNNRYSALIIEGINEKFSWALYGDFKVIMMNSNGYINATKLCKLGGKEFYSWKENKSSKELINEIEKIAPRNSGEQILIELKTEVGNDLRGTYVHMKLICHIASWVSPVFAIKVSEIVNNYYVREREREMEYIIQEKEDTIKKLEITVNEIKQINLNQTAEIEEIKQINLKQSTELEEIKQINLDQTNKIENQNERIHQLIEVSTNSYHLLMNKSIRTTVLPQDENKTYIIIMKHTDVQKISYSVIRCQQKNIEAQMKKTGGQQIICFENPNAIMLWNKFTENNTFIDKKYNSFTLINNYTEEQFIRDLETINNEKFNGCLEVFNKLRGHI